MSALEDYADVIEVADPERLSLYERENDNLALSEARIGKAVTALAKELESLQADTALGALVRRMPVGWCLWHSQGDGGSWDWHVDDDEDGPVGRSDTPEAALRQALPEEREADTPCATCSVDRKDCTPCKYLYSRVRQEERLAGEQALPEEQDEAE